MRYQVVPIKKWVDAKGEDVFPSNGRQSHGWMLGHAGWAVRDNFKHIMMKTRQNKGDAEKQAEVLNNRLITS